MVKIAIRKRLQAPRRKSVEVLTAVLVCICVVAWSNPALAHAVAKGDKGYIQEITGSHLMPFAMAERIARSATRRAKALPTRKGCSKPPSTAFTAGTGAIVARRR